MRQRNYNGKHVKRAVRAGLFLGVLCCLAGCVKPPSQPPVTSTPQPEVTPAEPMQPTMEPELSATPIPPTMTPEPSPTPVLPTVTPDPTPTPPVETGSSPTPVPTPEQDPVVSPDPALTVTPDVTPTEEILPDPTPEITVTPEAVPTLSPTPVPTGMPEYDALLQNGWQRTEDFFENRGIYFSGRFRETELIREEGSYGYRYIAPEEPEIALLIMGEEAGVQLLLDELMQREGACDILQEGPEDYSYLYVAGDSMVKGRVYACYVAEQEYRMRVELHYPALWDTQKEGYDFYLR